MTTTHSVQTSGPKEPPTLTEDEFVKQVLHKNTGEEDSDGTYNRDLNLGGYNGYKGIGDVNHDNIPDGSYDFSSGYTVLAISRAAASEQAADETENKDTKERPDINANRRPEDPPFAQLKLQDGTVYDLVREDPPLKVLQVPKLPKGEEEIVRPAHTNFTSADDFRKSVLTEGGALNIGWALGGTKGAVYESDLTGDGVPDRVFNFDSGQSILLVSNYGAKEKQMKPGRTSNAYAELYAQWQAMGDKSAWIASHCGSGYDVGDVWDGETPVRRPVRVRTIDANCAASYDNRLKELNLALNDFYEEVPMRNWQDVDDDARLEHLAGSVVLPQANGTQTTYAILIEDAKMWTEGQ